MKSALGVGAAITTMAALLIIVSLGGCTDATWSGAMSLGSKYRITVYSGNTAVKTYTSSGRVAWHEAGGGCEFKDDATGKHVRASGTITAEEL